MWASLSSGSPPLSTDGVLGAYSTTRFNPTARNAQNRGGIRSVSDIFAHPISGKRDHIEGLAFVTGG
jgi:hypothetical protein